MNFFESLIPLAGVFFLFGYPMMTFHQRKMYEIKMRNQAGLGANAENELRALSDQMIELRDTTTRYDMGFDSALQRIESRLGNLESRVSTIDNSNSAGPTG